MPTHAATVGAELHVFARVTSSDPGAIGAGKGWIDTSSGPPYQLKIRNSGNSGWEAVGVTGDFATGSELETVEDALTAHEADTANPHNVTAAQTGAMVNPMTTPADIIAAGLGGVPIRLAKGANDTVLGVDGSGVFGYKADPSGGGSGGHTIEDEGTPLASRSKLNFVGTGVTVTDDSGDDATVVTIASEGSLETLKDAMKQLLVLDAGEGITKDGSDLVSVWGDQGMHSNDVMHPTSTNQPLWVDNVVNGEPVVRFDGTSDYMYVPGVSLTGHGTTSLAFVIAPKDTGTAEGLLAVANGGGNGNANLIAQRDGTNVKLYVNGGFRWTIAHATDTFKLYVLTWDGVTWNLYINGVAETPYVGGTTGETGLFWLGVGYNGYGNVDIAAVELYKGALSGTPLSDLHTRLMTKYGL